MRIAAVSDLHVDLNGDPTGARTASALAAALRSARAELLVVAGDVANDYRRTLRVLERIETAAGLRCLFVAGNHDLWNENGAAARGSGGQPVAPEGGQPLPPGWRAWDSYRALEAFPGNLARGPVELAGGAVVIGDAGWYDFGFGGPGHTPQEFERMRLGRRLWWDKVNAVWDRPTREMHRTFAGKLERQLAAYAGRKILLVTHVVPVAELTVQNPDRMWSYLNAFLGSPEYGRLARRYAVSHAVCGHVHYRRQVVVGTTRFVCSCLGYAHEWARPGDLEGEVARSLTTLEL